MRMLKNRGIASQAGLGLALGTMLLVVSLPAQAQQAKNVRRIGYLVSRSAPGANDQAFQDGLRELGYVEGQNLVIERRWVGETRGGSLTWPLIWSVSRLRSFSRAVERLRW
jgi:hypothetical protein